MDVPKLSVKLSLWPPTESTRLKLIEKMAKNLVTPSIWSRKYGLLSQKEAEAEAKQIESDSFAAATQHFDKEPDSDGTSAVEFYAKESSKRMIEVIKRGPLTRADEEEQQEQVISLQKKVKQNDGITFDISGDPRKEIDSHEAQILLNPLKNPGNGYRRIRFSNTSFGRDAALIAKPILSSVKDQLADVDLSDIVAGRQEEEAIEVMNIFSLALQGSNLRLLDLSDNALGGKGVDAFGDLLRSQHSLEELYLNNCGISEDAAEALFVSVPSTEKLKVLQLHNNMVGDEGAAAIAHMVSNSPSLENFRCSCTRIASDGGLDLVKSLGKCPHLKKLDLRDNMFGVDVALALSHAISLFSELSELHLGYVNLEDEGALAVANVLTNSAPSLRVLDFTGNEITAKAAPALAACISSKRLLSEINLSENELKDEGAILIAKALEESCRELSELDMSCNGIRRAGARRLAQVFVAKPEFSSLNINGNFISDEGIDEIKELFKNCPAVLGPLDENDPEGEDYDEEHNEANSDEGRELEAKLKGLDLKQGEEEED